MSNFIEDCIAGNTLIKDIDNYIDVWHDGDSNMPLDAFLGITSKEYSAFVKDESILSLIVTAHKYNVDFDNLLHSHTA